MRIRRILALAAAVGAVAALAAGASSAIAAGSSVPGTALAESSAPRSQLSADAQRVVDYLVDDWGQRFRSTSIPLAMNNLGIEPNDSVRLEVLAHFHAHTDLARNLVYWGPNNYVFSNQEKLIAKYLIHMSEREERAATVSEASEALSIDGAFLRERLAFMAEASFLVEDAGQELGFSLAPGYKRWAGPLQHNFHTVTVDGGKPFDVW